MNLTLTRACSCGGALRVTVATIADMADFNEVFAHIHAGAGHTPTDPLGDDQ